MSQSINDYFFFNDTATTEIYTLSLHDSLPISAPVAAVPDELSKKITGRKLFVCADRDSLRATPNVLGCFTAASAPKKLVLFGGRKHSRAMFSAVYGDEALGEIVEFVCRRG